MNKSESIKNIATALSVFQIKVEKLKKTAENPFFKSKYVPLSEVIDTIQIPLNEAGLTYSQFPDGDSLTTILMHPDSGEWIEASGNLHLAKSDPQSMGSALTYLRRYALCAILGLSTEDDDGNKATQAKPEDDGKPWLNDKDVQAAIDHIKAGNPLADILAKYKISKANREKINEAIK